MAYLTRDNQTGFILKTSSAVNCVYLGMMSVYDHIAMSLKAAYANVMQPPCSRTISRERRGALRLNHTVYFMGANLLPDPVRPDHFVLHAHAGVVDAHSESFHFDVAELLVEMSPRSEVRKSGQVYRP